MAISETLRNAVNDKDITAIRSCFYTIILSDPGFKSKRFEEALNFVKASNVDGVMDLHDGEELFPEEEWNEAYFDLLASKMQDNFSEERIAQLKKVAKKIYGTANNEDIENKKNSSKDKGKARDQSSIEDYTWIGIVGAVIAILWVFRRIFKRRK